MNRRKFLASAGASLAVTQASSAFAKKATAPLKKPSRPNIIVMICDDLGFGDLGCYGSKLSTPNLDRLAKEGVRCTNYTTPHPVCSPSRAALLTGKYPQRTGVNRVYFPMDTVGMATGTDTLADMVGRVGYRTMAIGKWHLGHTPELLPTSRGFQEYLGVPYSVDMDPLPLLRNEHVEQPEADRDELTPTYTKAAVDFIHRAGDDPFFLYMAFSYPHIPIHASSRFRGKSKAGIYGDAVSEIDWSVGEVLAALEKQKIRENTLVIFTSDHGPWFQGSTGGLRGRKGTTYEGGARIACLLSMPSALPQGVVQNNLLSHMDIAPTLSALCGAKQTNAAFDGTDVWPVLTGEKAKPESRVLLNFMDWDLQCARMDNWKLHISRYSDPPYLPPLANGRRNYSLRHPELYNLDLDPAESYDVADQNPEIVAAIQKGVAAELTTLPQQVHTAYRRAQETPSNQWMPPGSGPEVGNAHPGTRGWLKKEDDAKALSMYK